MNKVETNFISDTMYFFSDILSNYLKVKAVHKKATFQFI